jgi:hypothetical protein
MEAQMEIAEQLMALSLLIDFLFGITLGVVFGAVHGSRRGALLVPAADDLRSAGARVIYGVWTRGYPQGPLSVNDQASGEPHRHEVDR